ncbi:hypothetical protein BDM02DRAFT_3125103 [Thelephora ganbajun]|uniref:Uncharacterized protein n=1 Tax=Thelephora ganbajun TaxID=370292 RepID=A0ACB6ZWJ1_THEGA|nr:hypothetical protein BDM02DRAFT_3125103 [Thelephora ganbajun]
MSLGPLPSFTHERFTTLSAESGGNKRMRGSREGNFTIKHGSRHHSYDPEKAPYPLSYDREFIGMDLLDHAFLRSVARTSTVHFRVPPTKVLELGCGPGHWVIDAAKEWPGCDFVGFDLVNIQPPASYLDPSISKRVTWIHGNFLTKRLPFDEDEFDYVRVKFIAKGVPENKEIHRVLCPGGIMEAMEEDIRFPTLPKWFTTPLRAHAKRTDTVHLPDGSSQPSSPIPSSSKHVVHDHALLESLYYSVFETRFVNIRPTAICPAYASAIFRHVRSVPISLKLPPFAPPPPPIDVSQNLPPVPPLPLDIVTKPDEDGKPDLPPLSTSVQTISTDTLDSPSSGSDSESIRTPPPLELDTAANAPEPERQPQSSLGTSSFHSASTFSQLGPREAPSLTRMSKTFRPMKKATSRMHNLSEVEDLLEYDLSSLASDIDEVGRYISGETLMTHLHRMVVGVTACKESMWEELKDRLRHKQYEKELRELGWEDEEGAEELQERKRFEKMLERYKEDMHHRVAHWRTLVKMGWELPLHDPTSRLETLEEERLRQAMIEGQKLATEEDLQTPLRTFRIIVGVKDID